MTMDARVTRMKKFLHKIIDLNREERLQARWRQDGHECQRQEAELRTRIAKLLSGRVRPTGADK